MAAGLTLFLLQPAAAQSPPSEDVLRERDLDGIRRQIEGLQSQLLRIDEESSGLEAELRRTDV